jgi:hypothetical protein
MRGWFVPPRVTSRLLANPQVSHAANGGVVWGREIACGAVSGKFLAQHSHTERVLIRLMLVVLIPADGFRSSG